MTTPYEYESDCEREPAEQPAAEPASVLPHVANGFLERARALARANPARPSLRVGGARLGDAVRPAETEPAPGIARGDARRLPTKRTGLRINASALGRRGLPDDSGEGVA